MRADAVRLEAMFEHNPVGAALLDADGSIAEVNLALARFLGRRRDDLVGRPLDDFVVDDPEDPHQDDPLAEDRRERRFRNGAGQVVWGLVSTVDLGATPGLPAGSTLLAVEDLTSRRNTERLLLHAALHDSLTNLPNRRLLRDRLDTALARASRSTKSVGVLFLDLNHFKSVNDSLGHAAGDEMLVAIARNIISVLRTCDTVARLGGDEFVVVCEDVAGEGDVSRLAGRVSEAVSRPVVLRGRQMSVTASIGVAVAGEGHESGEELIRLADLAMYRAKRGVGEPGGGSSDYVPADTAVRGPASRRELVVTARPLSGDRSLVPELRHAIQTDQLELHYQPVVRFDGTLLGLEALLRWPHPTRGQLLPHDFLPVVEDSELAKPLSDWVLRTAISDAASWHDPSLRVSVNVWASEVARPGFAETVAELLTWAGLQARGLYLEIREQELADVGTGLADELHQLRLLGVGLAIDDYGAGGSSLADLRRLPVDTLKMDRALADPLRGAGPDPAVVLAVVAAARATGRHPLATGVETVEQLTRLREMGFESLQGYLTGRPAPLVELRGVILERRVDISGS
jgi:diguanylate cyclase (GGDEF)-like protein/PAS domain S-box-containing protein